MPTTVRRVDALLDPNIPATVEIINGADTVSTYVTLGAASLCVGHWRSEYEPGDWSPEAFAAWLRAAADAIDAAWAARRLAEQHEPLEVQA